MVSLDIGANRLVTLRFMPPYLDEDERAYLDEWPMTEAQKQTILDRDYNRAIDEGGNVYFLSKVFFTDGQSFLQAVGTMTGMDADEYQAMMLAGGRSADGVRSKKANALKGDN